MITKIFFFTFLLCTSFGSNHKFNQPFIDVAESANPSIVSIISEIEVKQRNQSNSHKPIQSKNPAQPPTKKQQLKKETEEEILYASFNRYLLEDED